MLERDGLGVVFYLLAPHQLLEAADLLAGTEHDEGVAGVDGVVGGGGGVELALQATDGEDHGTGLLPDLELAYGTVGQGRLLGHAELFEPELDALLAAGHDVEEVTIRGWVAREASLRPP